MSSRKKSAKGASAPRTAEVSSPAVTQLTYPTMEPPSAGDSSQKKTARASNAKPKARSKAKPKPGSCAYMIAEADRLAAAGINGAMAVADRFNDEKIAATEGPLVSFIKDEWYGRIEEGNPFDEAVQPFIEANPDKQFRFLSPRIIEKRGTRGYQTIRDPKTGKEVVVSGQKLGWIPKEVAVKRKKTQAERTNEMRRQSREQYQETQDRLRRESEGQLTGLNLGGITETIGHHRRNI